MKKLPLPHGLFALVDDEDFERCSGFRWHVNDYGYALRNIIRLDGTRTKQRLSRFIVNAPDGVYVDHINCNTLDNRKANLRLCSNQQNICNSRKHHDNTSGFKGVTWSKDKARWQAQIMNNGKYIFLGRFRDINEAAAAYAAASKKYHGEFSRT